MVGEFIFFSVASFFEIFGCYAFWMVMREEKPTLWIVLGIISLILFAWSLAKIDVSFAGKAYAVYGGIYIAASILWLWGIEKVVPSKWDLIGAGVSLLGAMIIFLNSKNI
ncbi:MAG: YnfA family protein [Sulfuricurvum sp.]|nr:YnfA family protein [Sulfuricurvum sp.]MDD2950731.1 YnfA family protein [Sulfuricurvum sp.]